MKRIKIIFEDDNILVINKPSNLICQDTKYENENTVANWLRINYPNSEFDQELYDRQGLVHRLDQETSGLLLVAKNMTTLNKLKAEMQDHKICREYLAIAWGRFEHKHFIINLPMKRSRNNTTKMVVSKENDAKSAKTEIFVLAEYRSTSLLRCILHTGRTHQIRCHLSYIKHPVFNDLLYGKDDGYHHYGQFLCAYKIQFKHPINHEIISLEVEPDEIMSQYIKEHEDEIIY